MIRNLNKNQAFTLAEAILVLVVLGIVAAITIPSVIRRQIEAANRTKIKKANRVYDFLVNKIVAEHDIHSKAALRGYGENCTGSSEEFKVNQFAKLDNGNNNLCRFKTSDNVWWDITNLDEPIVALSLENLDKPDNKTTFHFQTDFDTNGAPRINDLGYSNSQNVEKLVNYMLNKKDEIISKPGVINDYMWKKYPTNCYKLGADKSKWAGCTVPKFIVIEYSENNTELVFGYAVLDENGQVIEEAFKCNYDRECFATTHALSDGKGGYIPIFKTIEDYEYATYNDEFINYEESYPELYEQIAENEGINIDFCKTMRCFNGSPEVYDKENLEKINW